MRFDSLIADSPTATPCNPEALLHLQLHLTYRAIHERPGPDVSGLIMGIPDVCPRRASRYRSRPRRPSTPCPSCMVGCGAGSSSSHIQLSKAVGGQSSADHDMRKNRYHKVSSRSHLDAFIHTGSCCIHTTTHTPERESQGREGGPPERARGREHDSPSNLLLESKARTVCIHSRSVNAASLT